MKFTDRYFKFPIKVYDGWEMTKAMMKEEKQLEDDPDIAQLQNPAWTACWQTILPEEILGWGQNFSREVDIEEVDKDGPDLTQVETKRQGVFPCMWKMDKFEKKLNEFYEEYYSDSINSNKKIQ